MWVKKVLIFNFEPKLGPKFIFRAKVEYNGPIIAQI